MKLCSQLSLLLPFQKSSEPESPLALVPIKTVVNSIAYSNNAQYARQWQQETESKSGIVYSSKIPDTPMLTFLKQDIIKRPMKEPKKLHLRKKTTRDIKAPDGLYLWRTIATARPWVKMLKRPRSKQRKWKKKTIDRLSYSNPVYVLNSQKPKHPSKRRRLQPRLYKLSRIASAMSETVDAVLALIVPGHEASIKRRKEDRIPLDQSLLMFSVASGIVAAILSI